MSTISFMGDFDILINPTTERIQALFWRLNLRYLIPQIMLLSLVVAAFGVP